MFFTPVNIIKSENFVLRPINLEKDKESIIKNINDEEILKYMARAQYPYTEDEDYKNFCQMVKDASCEKNNWFTILGIYIEGECVGSVGLGRGGTCEEHKGVLSYWLGRSHWGKGVMVEAVRLMTEIGFNEIGLLRIEACVFSPNEASLKVLEKNDFRLEGILKNNRLKLGELYDTFVYAKLKNEGTEEEKDNQ